MGYIIAAVVIVVGIVFAAAILRGKKDRSAPPPEELTLESSPQESVNRKRGKRGEEETARVLAELDSVDNRVFNDLFVTDEYGDISQIDHVLINRFGIWVIETKNYVGRISGKDGDRKWTQYCGNQVNAHGNPVKQNATHLFRLKSRMGIKQRIFHNLVVFVGDAELVVDSQCVCDISQLKARVGTYNGVTLGKGDIEKYSRILREIKRDSDENREEYTMRIIIKGTEKCPVCGAELTVRYSDDGKYYVCTNERVCNYAIKIGDGWN